MYLLYTMIMGIPFYFLVVLPVIKILLDFAWSKKNLKAFVIKLTRAFLFVTNKT